MRENEQSGRLESRAMVPSSEICTKKHIDVLYMNKDADACRFARRDRSVLSRVVKVRQQALKQDVVYLHSCFRAILPDSIIEKLVVSYLLPTFNYVREAW